MPGITGMSLVLGAVVSTMDAMEDDLPLRASIGAVREEPPSDADAGIDPALVRLYTALKQLDGALHDALRALDVAFGRSPSTGPPDALPYREIGRLKNQLEAAVRPRTDRAPRSLGEIAMPQRPDEDAEDRDDGAPPRAGVAPRPD